jgi:hypothetical protein
MSYRFIAKLADGRTVKFNSAHGNFGAALTECMKSLSEAENVGADAVSAISGMTAKRRDNKSALVIVDAKAEGEKPAKAKKAKAK